MNNAPTPRYLFRRYELVKLLESGNNFLEIGPGKLIFTKELLVKFKRGELIELNPEVKKYFFNLETEQKRKLTLHVINFEKFKTNKKFDLIVACEVMEHVKEDKKFLKMIYKILNKNGSVIISVPSRMKYWGLDDELVGHYRRYEKINLIKIFQDANFEVEKIISYGFPFTNLLRIIRNKWFAVNSKKLNKLTKINQSKESGFPQYTDKASFLYNWIINKVTFLPLNIFASLFNKLDIAEGYIVKANKVIN